MWLMQRGVPIRQAAGYRGMSAKMISPATAFQYWT
jgi:hypothetical protein